MTDDQGYGDLACLGNPIIKTPNLDKLHDESVRFTDFHVNCFCAPTRAALMTGRMSDRTHVRSTINLRNYLNKEETTMAEFFKTSGYKTAQIGKWHIGGTYPYRPMDRGFDFWLGQGDGGTGTSSDYWGNDRVDDHYIRNGKWEKIKGFGTDIFFDETMKFIKRNKEKPFFVYLATYVPHGPMNALKEWRKQYEDKNIPGSTKWGDTKDLYATLTRFDHNMGRLRQFLKNNNLDDNTILIFLTDNGTANGQLVYNAGMRGRKGSMYDGGHRVPCFIYWPKEGIKKAIDIDKFTSHVDLLPTLKDMCNLKTPKRGHLKFDGRSLVPLIHNKNSKWDDRTLFMHQQNARELPVKWQNSLVATSQWRMINGNQLYDIKKDPSQKNNVIKDFPDIKKDLTNRYNNYWNEIDLINNPYPRIIIGNEKLKQIWLNCDNWIRDTGTEQSWDQIHVLKANKTSGFWPIKVESSRNYSFEVRRWPKEIDKPISAALPASKHGDVYLKGELVTIGEGVAIPANKVRLEIGDKVYEKQITPDDTKAEFNIELPKCKTEVRAWLVNGNQKRSAYYIYVR